MKYIKKFILIAALAASLYGVSSGKENNNIELSKFVKPRVSSLTSNHLKLHGTGTIDIVLLVDEQGHVDDWLPVETSDKVFVNAIDQVIDRWVFKPVLIDGKASWTFFKVKIKFDHSGGLVFLDVGEAVYAKYGFVDSKIRLVIPFQELDNIPKPVVMEKPQIHLNLLRDYEGAEMKFQIYIDKQGNVRMPVLISSDVNVVAAGITLETISKWKFEPPMYRGRPVATKVLVPFIVN